MDKPNVRIWEVSDEFHLIEFDTQLKKADAYEVSFWEPEKKLALERDVPTWDIKIEHYENRIYFTFPSGREIEIDIPIMPSLMRDL